MVPGRNSVKTRSREPSIPEERSETVRREIAAVLKGSALSAKEISAQVRLSEKEVYDHLEHIRRTLNKKDCRFIVQPAECIKCGFVFRKREKLKKPGRCPVCKGELIQEQLFNIRGTCR
jgi:predicted Zn-ribbon and HTH transcriptional regulator